MFVHNFTYTLKILFKNRMLIFWTYAFPIILGLLFSLAFSDIEKNEMMDIIPIAIVEKETEGENLENATSEGEEICDSWEEGIQTNQILKEALNTLSEKGENQLFRTEYLSLEQAKQQLEKEKIIGYLVLSEEEPKVVVRKSGIDETVFGQVVSQVLQETRMIASITEKAVQKEIEAGNFQVDVEALAEKALASTQQQEITLKDISSEHLSYTMIEYYTLIAMTCLYSSMLGMFAINNVLANMSRKGMRVSVSPARKGSLILSSMCASYVVQLIGLLILFLFTILVMKVDYGTNLWGIGLLALVGSLAGLSMGVAVSALIKAGENTKTGIIISITMLGCFLSGMMGITMKYIVDKNLPILNKINPAGMITDGFYSLYYYETLDRFWWNVGSLLVFSLLMFGISFRALKKQVYEQL